MMLAPDDPRAPRYWRYEVGGKLAPAIERYLLRRPEQPDDTLLIRTYLTQWIHSPVWQDVGGLRASVLIIRTRHDIERWLDAATDLGIDPL